MRSRDLGQVEGETKVTKDEGEQETLLGGLRWEETGGT